MSEELIMKIGGALVTVIIATLATFRYMLRIWLQVKMKASEHEANLEKENIGLKKENIDKGFDQLKEADQFMRVALVQVARALKETTSTTNNLSQTVRDFGIELKEVQATAALKIQEATTRIEALEVKIQSVVKDLGEGKVRVSGPKF